MRVLCLAAAAAALALPPAVRAQDQPPPAPDPKVSRAAQVRREAALYLRRAVNQVTQGQFEAALKDLESLIQVELANPDAYFLLGVCHLELGHYREALAAFTTVTEIDPRSADGFHGVALVHQRQQDWEGALRACLRALRVDKQHVQAWNDLGIAYAHLERSSKAIAAFRRALELAADAGEALANLVQLQVQLGDSAEAVELIEQRLGDHPDDPAALVVGATLYRQLGRGADAATLETRLESLPKSKRKLAERLGDQTDLEWDAPEAPDREAGLELQLARALLDRGLAARALELLPADQSGEVAALRARILFSIGRYREAAAAFEAAAGYGAPAPLHYDRGLALELAGDAAAAEQQFEAALEADPAFVPALYRLGTLRLEQQQFEPALRAFQELLAQAPNHVLAEPASRRVAELRRKLGR
ncbi:MAG TPA: tetratricopeptide repeat protein [Acidobacteriota bacterium]